MKVVLLLVADAADRRRVSDALLRAGFGVCESHRSDLIPAITRIDVVVADACDASLLELRLGSPVVRLTHPVRAEDVLTDVGLALHAEEPEAA